MDFRLVSTKNLAK